ncbi:hypothetical protein Droror1_Dr00017412 [Drosera rotundifolia]
MAKIALGTSREFVQPDCIQPLVVEFICTFLFVFAGVESAMAAAKLYASPFVGLFFVGITHAFVVTVMVAAALRISGGNLNPAVTVGLALDGHITIFRLIFYWIDQLAASAAACFLLHYLTGGLETPPHVLGEGMNPLQG